MPPEPQPSHTVRNVLAVVVGPRDTAAVLAVALPIVSESAGRLTLLAAIAAVPGWAYAGASTAGVTTSWARGLELQSEHLLADAARAAPAGISVRTVLVRGSLEAAVREEIERSWQDLVIVSASAARRCRGGLPFTGCRVALAERELPILVVKEKRRGAFGARLRQLSPWVTRRGRRS